jgi:hypothetical protein
MLLPKGVKAQMKRLANTSLLPDTCTITRYEKGDGYSEPGILATAQPPCRIRMKQTTIDIGGGQMKNYAGTITLPGDAFTWTAPVDPEADPDTEPETFQAIAQVNDRITHNGIEYRVDHLGEPRIDATQLNYVAYLEHGYPAG